MSPPLETVIALPLITFILVLIKVWWDRRWKLRDLPTPVCLFVVCFGCLFTLCSSLSQAGASLVWGHEKVEFEDDQGSQSRAWFNECGRAFKIKAAWGHPDIVSREHTCARAPALLTVMADELI
jgi:hypothetical protein